MASSAERKEKVASTASGSVKAPAPARACPTARVKTTKVAPIRIDAF